MARAGVGVENNLASVSALLRCCGMWLQCRQAVVRRQLRRWGLWVRLVAEQAGQPTQTGCPQPAAAATGSVSTPGGRCVLAALPAVRVGHHVSTRVSGVGVWVMLGVSPGPEALFMCPSYHGRAVLCLATRGTAFVVL